MRWDLAHIAEVTGGEPHGEARVTSVVTDSRDASEGSLFVALRGEAHDGHDFAAAAIDAGASACLVEAGRLPAGASGVEVRDTLTALWGLARHRRAGISVPVVAITGSSGKTSTKDMAAAALGARSHAAPRSFNNEVGVPLTILSVDDEASSVVVEVGSRGVGHIEALADMVRPDVAVITNVGPAHLEMFGDLDTVAAAKWELVEALSSDGVAVLPVDLEPPTPTDVTVLRFGVDRGDVALTDIEVDALGRVTCTVRFRTETARLEIPLPGRHQALNAAAALAVAVALGEPLAGAAERLEAATVSPWRMELTTMSLAGGTVVVVNDAYNANPSSMTAALETVAEIPGRHIAVLGRMLELGDREAEYHRDIGALATSLGYEAVIVVGDDPGIREGAGARAAWAEDPDEAVRMLLDLVEPSDVVLVKASRAVGLEGIPQALMRGIEA